MLDKKYWNRNRINKDFGIKEKDEKSFWLNLIDNFNKEKIIGLKFPNFTGEL